MARVKLTYFKRFGKYYSSGEYDTDSTYFFDVVNEVRKMKIDGKLPGLVNGSNEFIVLIDTQEPWGVPHIIP